MLEIVPLGAIELTKETLVQDLSMVLLVAGIVAALFHVISWPKVIGYIAAGALISLGPIKALMIADEDSVNVLANLGVVFLMLNLGLDLNFRKLKASGGTVFPAALFDLGAMLLVGYGVGHYVLKWEFLPSLFLGAVICDSSTTLLAKSLSEMGCEKEKFASIIFGITISEDVLTIGVMAVLTGLALTGQFQARELALQLGYLGLFLAGVLGFGLLLLPRLLNSLLARLKDNETVLLIVMGICFGIALIAEKMQFSLALGAFLVGAVVSQSKVRHRIVDDTFGLRSVFSAVFFVTIGMMVDFPSMWANKWLILLIAAVVLVFKTLNILVVSFVTGQSFRDSAQIGVGLAQLGDFAYLVAMMGVTLQNGESPYPEMYQVAVGVSVITTLVNPFLLKGAGKAADRILGIMPGGVRKCMENYTLWVQRAQTSLKAGKDYRQFLLMSFWYGFNLVLLCVIFMIGAWVLENRALWQSLPEIVVENAPLWMWVLCFFLCCPLFANGFFLSRRLGKMLCESSIAQWLRVLGHWQNAIQRFVNICVTTLGMAIVIIIFCIMSALVCFRLDVVLTMFFLLGVLVVWRWKSFRRFFHETQEALQGVLSQDSDDDGEAADGVVAEGGALGESSVVVPGGAGVIGISLKKLQVRNHTGATVSRIVRSDGEVLQSPGAEDCLFAGDTVYFLCAAGREAKVCDYFCRGEVPVHEEALAAFLDMHIEEMAVVAGSSVCGQTLAEARLRNVAGVTVMRIVRGDGTAVGMPGPGDVLLAGDRVSVLGTQAQIERARAILERKG